MNVRGWALVSKMKSLSLTALTIFKHAVKFQFPWDKILFAHDAGKIYNSPLTPHGFWRVWMKYLFFFNSITFLLTAEGTLCSKRGAQPVNGWLLICPQEKRNLNATQPFVSVTLWLVERADWLKGSAGGQNSLKMAKIPAELCSEEASHKRNYTGELRPF